MELDYKILFEKTMRDLKTKTEFCLMYESLAEQKINEVRELQNKITEKDTKIENLEKQINDLKITKELENQE